MPVYSWGFRRTISLIIVFFLHAIDAEESRELEPRSKYNIPLVKLKLAMDDRNEKVEHVRIPIDGYKEYALIAYHNDTYVHYKRNKINKIVYAETPERAYMLSKFEARQLSNVVQSFIRTLEIFNNDLKKERWDRCLYLDAFFPRFLSSFYFLVCAARASSEGFPAIGRIPEDKYDVSLRSEKSDRRIQQWRSQKDYIIKLRIITKELIYQLKSWDQKELKKKDGAMRHRKVEKAFELFVRVYFNLKPTAGVPEDGEHL